MDKKRERALEIQEEIRNVLFRDWDPMDVNDLAPEDEYDNYIGSVYRMLATGTDVAKLSQHLRQLEITQMEMPTNDEHRRSVAERLLRLNISLAE